MSRLLQFQVERVDEGQRLDRFLASRLGGLSRMHINTLLADGACVVNKSCAVAGYHLACGDVVEITFDEGTQTAMTPEPIALDVVYEDAHLLVVNKAAGMLVHPTRGEKSGTLANALSFHLNSERTEDSLAFVRPGLVHRLDRATSGLMVVAKHQRALSILTRHFHERLISKRYLALLQGLVSEDEQLVQAPIGRDPQAHPKWRVSTEGRHAETRLRVVERRDTVTLAELEPVTGRTNQLRIHCAHIQHPIVGDQWYGNGACARLCLHASQLCFHHPSGGDWMEFASPLPEEILNIMQGAE